MKRKEPRGRARLIRRVNLPRARLIARAADNDARKEMVSARRADRSAAAARVYGPGTAYLGRWWNHVASFASFEDAAGHLTREGGQVAPVAASIALVTVRRGKPACVLSRWIADGAGNWVPI